jgi:thymidylate synthase (FAD)
MKIGEHGLVELYDRMPSGDEPERRIVEAARMSVTRDPTVTKLSSKDKNLIRFLWRNEHASPFEMIQLTFMVKCPIFIARQWFRHRTGSFNEFSARYSVMKDEFYIPEARMQNKVNHQMSDDREVPEELQSKFDDYMKESAALYDKYKELVDEGIAKEVARMGLGVNIYTQFMWSVNLRNLIHFLNLRMAEDAQPEIRDYAIAIYEIVKPLFPITFSLMDKKGIKFTAEEVEVLKRDYDISFSHTTEATGTLAESAHKKLIELII